MAHSNRLSQRYLGDLSRNQKLLFSEGFEPLLRYIDANSPMHERIGYSVSLKQDPLRLGQTPLMHFHASPFSNVSRQAESGQFKLNNVYWGLFGINGPLPLHMTEFAIERNYRHQDNTLPEFCDIFHHRFISLFYRSWAIAQPTVNCDRPEHNIFTKQISSFSGCFSSSTATNTPSKTITNQKPQGSAFPADDSLAAYLGGLYSIKNRSSGALEQILSEYLQCNVRVQQFDGQWYQLPSSEQNTLGQKNARLGLDCTLGDMTFERGFNFSIFIGPLSYENYLILLDNSQHFEMIKTLTTRHVGSEYNFTIKVLLNNNEQQPSFLGEAALGKSTWLLVKVPDSNEGAPSVNRSEDANQIQHQQIAYQYVC